MNRKNIAKSIRGSCYALLSNAEEAIEAGHSELYEGLLAQIGATIEQLQNQKRNLEKALKSDTTNRGHRIF